MAHRGATIANVLGFQAVWLASVGGAGAGLAWAGPVAALLFAAATLAWAGRLREDLRVLAIALPLGLLLDSAFAASGWLRYAEPWPWAFAAPAWIMALWLGFALTLNHSMAFLRGRLAWAALFGAVGGPLAYSAARRAFAAVEFGAPDAWVLLALAAGWATVLPLILLAQQRFDAAAPRRQPA